ncbi:MAG: hypothetical protein J6I40_03745 [Mailhella sp.]|nr:hypothetical protein [Mailhella sp.]
MALQKSEAGKQFFSCGLEQPAGSFRFSEDALVLANAAAALPLPEDSAVCDLGTGCGVAAFAVLMQHPGWVAAGLEKEPELAAAAERNAVRLDLASRFCSVRGDAAEESALRLLRSSLESLRGEQGKSGGPLFDAVMCNPPWKMANRGRVSPGYLRRSALFGTDDTYRIFFSAADRLLKNRAVLIAVAGAERTADMLAALPDRLNPELLTFCLTRGGTDAEWVILLARKNGRAQLKVSMQMQQDSAFRPE